MRTRAGLVFVMFFMLGGCILGMKQRTDGKLPAGDKPIEGARVQAAWQTKMAETLSKSEHSDAWGLFSQGGWVDRGQVMFFGSAQGAKSKQVVAPGVKDAPKLDSATVLQSDVLAKSIEEGEKLGDYQPTRKIFDAISYEYVHLQKGSDGKVALKKRIYMNSPLEESAPEHLKLVRAMQSVR